MTAQPLAVATRVLHLAEEPGERAQERNGCIVTRLVESLAYDPNEGGPRMGLDRATSRGLRFSDRHLGNLRGRGFHG